MEADKPLQKASKSKDFDSPRNSKKDEKILEVNKEDGLKPIVEEKIKVEEKKEEGIKVFNLYELEEIKVEDPGLKRYVNLEPKLIIKSHGRNRGKLAKTKINIIERLANQIAVPGHRRKKHRIITGHASGKFEKNMKFVLDAFEIIAKKTGENPVKVFIKAVENAAPRDEITVIEYGGARYPQAVDVAPARRISLALRWLVHGSYDKSFKKKTKISQALADEILKAYEKSAESYSIQRKNESEKQADSAR